MEFEFLDKNTFYYHQFFCLLNEYLCAWIYFGYTMPKVNNKIYISLFITIRSKKKTVEVLFKYALKKVRILILVGTK